MVSKWSRPLLKGRLSGRRRLALRGAYGRRLPSGLQSWGRPAPGDLHDEPLDEGPVGLRPQCLDAFGPFGWLFFWVDRGAVDYRSNEILYASVLLALKSHVAVCSDYSAPVLCAHESGV